MRAPAVGRDGIRSELERQYKFYSDCKCVIHRVGIGENCVFTERTDTVTLNHNGQEVETRLNAVFDMDAENRIIFWREYYDSGDLAKKLGVTLEQFKQIMATS
jgi:limonene-1,2-epoxide hydrolase